MNEGVQTQQNEVQAAQEQHNEQKLDEIRTKLAVGYDLTQAEVDIAEAAGEVVPGDVKRHAAEIEAGTRTPKTELSVAEVQARINEQVAEKLAKFAELAAQGGELTEEAQAFLRRYSSN